MVNGFHLGAPHQRTTNIAARLKWLSSITLLENPAYWPDLPTNDTYYPKTAEGWKAYPQHVESCLNNNDFLGIFGRFGDSGLSIGKIVTKGHLQAAAALAGNQVQGALASNQVQAVDVETYEEDGGQIVSPQENDDAETEIGDAQMDMMEMEEETSFSKSLATEDEPDDDIMYDADGNPFKRVVFKAEDQPAQSSWIQTGLYRKDNDDTLKQITQYVNAHHNGDMAVLRGYLNHVKPNFSTISERTIRIAELGGVGLARFCMDDLQTDSEIYAEMAEHFQNKSRDSLAEAAQLNKQCQEVDKQIEKLEQSIQEWRLSSKKRSQVQQNLTQQKRHLAKLRGTSRPTIRSNRTGESHLRRLASTTPGTEHLESGDILKDDSFDERSAFEV